MVGKFTDVIHCTVQGSTPGHVLPPKDTVTPKLVEVKSLLYQILYVRLFGT